MSSPNKTGFFWNKQVRKQYNYLRILRPWLSFVSLLTDLEGRGWKFTDHTRVDPTIRSSGSRFDLSPINSYSVRVVGKTFRFSVLSFQLVVTPVVPQTSTEILFPWFVLDLLYFLSGPSSVGCHPYIHECHTLSVRRTFRFVCSFRLGK